METPVTAGFGDPETWGPCTGHPNDPRYDSALDEAIENEKYLLLGTPEFDDRNPANIGLAVADIVSHPRLASIMNLSGERKDLLGAIAAADFQAMGDAIRCISRDY